MRFIHIALYLAAVISVPGATSVQYEDCTGFEPKEGTERYLHADACFPRLRTHPEEFEVMKNTTTWSFIQEAPYVNLSAAFENEKDHPFLMRPFPCADFNQTRYNLTGIAFEIHYELRQNGHLCVWAGPDCLFNSLVDRAYLLSRDEQYKLGVTGFLLDTAERRCLGHFTAPLDDDSMVVIGRSNKRDLSRMKEALDSLFGPFLWSTWLAIVAMFTFYFLVALLIYRRISSRKWLDQRFWIGLFSFMYSASVTSTPYAQEGKSEGKGYNATRRPIPQIQQQTASVLISSAIILSIAFLVLIYEQGVNRFLFQEIKNVLSKKIRALSANDAAGYSMLENSAVEKMFDIAANPGGDLFDRETTSIPWGRCKNDTQCIDWVLNPDISVQGKSIKYTVMFSTMAKNYLLKRSNCGTLTEFETTELYQFSGAIWLSNAVPEKERKQFNIDLVERRESGTIGRIIAEATGEGCPTTPISISPFMLIFPKIFFTIPLLLLALFLGFYVPKSEGAE